MDEIRDRMQSLLKLNSIEQRPPPLKRLPQLSLYSNFTVHFHGERIYSRDSFESLINRNEFLSNIDYLKSAVKGEPVHALKTLPVRQQPDDKIDPKIKAFLEANHEVISEYAVIKSVDWHFIPPHALHSGL